MSRRKASPPENIEALLGTLKQRKAEDSGWREFQCELVTPLYGGGVEPGVVDTEMPIRASAIRGQLRFWWRIACARNLDAAEMFRREKAIWGGIGAKTPAASRVDIKVSSFTLTELEQAFDYGKPGQDKKYKSPPKPANWASRYALFPAQGKLSACRRKIEELPSSLAKPGLKFTLSIRMGSALEGEQRRSVETALAWWASFGGIGARTRRGLGAILVDGANPVTVEEVAAQGGLLKLTDPGGAPLAVWKRAVSQLMEFRQGLNVARNSPAEDTGSPAGRSWWPEADTLRCLTGHAHPRHRTRLVQPDVFPRAAFGLPICIQFKDKPKPGYRNAADNSRDNFDPEDHIIEPAGTKRDRMASPLILRPYWNGECWMGMALLLPGWKLALEQPLKFKGKTYIPSRWPSAIAERKRIAHEIRPMKGRADDPLSAFLDYFAKGK